MKSFQRKNGWSHIFQSKPFLILLATVILIFAWNVLSFWNKMQDTEQNRKLVEAKVAALKEQKEKLTADIESLKTDQGKERVFRENFGLAKEGENVIIVVEDKNLPAAPIKASNGFWSFFANLFK